MKLVAKNHRYTKMEIIAQSDLRLPLNLNLMHAHICINKLKIHCAEKFSGILQGN